MTVAADVVVVARGTPTVDEYGTTQVDWSAPTLLTCRGSVQPRTTDPADSNREGYASGWVAYLWPPDVGIGHRDRVHFAARVYEVDGEPQTWTIAGRPSHVEVPLRLWEG